MSVFNQDPFSKLSELMPNEYSNTLTALYDTSNFGYQLSGASRIDQKQYTLKYYKQKLGEQAEEGSNPTKDLANNSITYTLHVNDPGNGLSDFLGIRIAKESSLGNFFSYQQATTLKDSFKSALPECEVLKVDYSSPEYISVHCYTANGEVNLEEMMHSLVSFMNDQVITDVLYI